MTILCALTLCGCGTDLQTTIMMDQYPGVVSETARTSDRTEEDFEPARMNDKIYIVMSVDTEKRLIVLALPDSPRTIQYGYTQATEIFDEHGQYMSAARLEPGRAVAIGDLDDQAKLTAIQLAGSAWYQENVTRFSIDPSISMLVVGDTKYRYDEYLRVFSGDQEISLGQVNEGDVISVQGVGKRILSVQVEVGHGTIALTNTELFEGGWISLGTKIYAKITKDMILQVPEGRYELSVANDGYGDSKTVRVERAQVTTVDLNEYKGEGPKLCLVTFEVHVEDALLYIDGEPIDYGEPVELRYGVHRLAVIADGFETWERQLVIHSKEATVEIGEPELAGEDDTSEDDDGQADTQKPADGDRVTSGSSVSERTDDSETFRSEEKGTGSTNTVGGSTGDYGDYLDTIVDLIKSLTNQKDN